MEWKALMLPNNAGAECPVSQDDAEVYVTSTAVLSIEKSFQSISGKPGTDVGK